MNQSSIKTHITIEENEMKATTITLLRVFPSVECLQDIANDWKGFLALRESHQLLPAFVRCSLFHLLLSSEPRYLVDVDKEGHRL